MWKVSSIKIETAGSRRIVLPNQNRNSWKSAFNFSTWNNILSVLFLPEVGKTRFAVTQHLTTTIFKIRLLHLKGQLIPYVRDVNFWTKGGQLDSPVHNVTFLDHMVIWGARTCHLIPSTKKLRLKNPEESEVSKMARKLMTMHSKLFPITTELYCGALVQ